MKNISMEDNLFVFRNCILEDLMKMGYKYIARDKEGAIYAYSRKPTRRGNEWFFGSGPFSVDDKLEDISLLSRIFPDIEWENVEPFRIPYTDWKEVPVNTPVLYTPVIYTSGIGNGKTCVLHFCRYDKEKDRVILYAEGRTSFTEQGTMATCPERVTIYEQGEK